MECNDFLASLNEAQRAAVTAPPEAILVLAGAGSGKTRVLTHRIVWLLTQLMASPAAILAVTFTNKAANEVKGRVAQLYGSAPGGMWIGTFHGLCHRLLRLHWREAKLIQTFQVLDSDDQVRQIKRILKDLQIDESKFTPRQVASFINTKKDAGIRVVQLPVPNNNPYESSMLRIYTVYEQLCEKNGLVDFAEILLRAYELLRDNQELLAHYQGRFHHLLVDEFQDTNNLQYAWLKLLTGKRGSLFVVGDDDQSIYGWRGARIENIQKFSDDFTKTKIFRLEQNYRSTAKILAAANTLIANNRVRLGKNLWTNGKNGEAVLIYTASTDLEEARFVIERIQDWRARGGKIGDCAILYRANAQSRLFEQALSRASLPFRVYGGLRFYERAEIKDALGYLRLINNRADDAAFERVVNTPNRAIGDRTMEILRTLAREEGISLWQAAINAATQQLFAQRTEYAVTNFIKLINELAQTSITLEFHEIVDLIITKVALIDYYKKEDLVTAEGRAENLAELVSAAREFAQQNSGEEQLITLFISEAALGSEEAESSDKVDQVQLMTIHSAKGLEFPLVFMVGMEEDLFPNIRSTGSAIQLEEERRLCYVGMTRARQQLIFSYAEQRRIHGADNLCLPSRFIKEIPIHLTQEIRMRGKLIKPQNLINSHSQPPNFYPKIKSLATTSTTKLKHPTATVSAKHGLHHKPPPPSSLEKHNNSAALQVGQRVSHPRFGEGVILKLEANERIQINFDNCGVKLLVLGYTALKII